MNKISETTKMSLEIISKDNDFSYLQVLMIYNLLLENVSIKTLNNILFRKQKEIKKVVIEIRRIL